MHPMDIARFLSILGTEVTDTADSFGVEPVDAHRALAEMVAVMLCDHVSDNEAYYESRRPLDLNEIEEIDEELPASR